MEKKCLRVHITLVAFSTIMQTGQINILDIEPYLCGHLRPVRALEIFHVLRQIRDLLVQREVEVLEVGDLAQEGVDARARLLQLLHG